MNETDNSVRKKKIKVLEKKEESLFLPPRRKKIKKITRTYLQNSGLAYIQRFPCSVQHFEDVMLQKIRKSVREHESPSLEEASAWLKDLVLTFQKAKILDDSAYASGLKNSLERRGLSQKYIAQKMQQKGLSLENKSPLPSEKTEKEKDQIAAILLMRRKRMGCFAAKDKPPPPIARQLSTFARAGFDYETIRQTLRLSEEEADNILSITVD